MSFVNQSFQIESEYDIKKWKDFYIKYLFHIKGDRNAILSKLEAAYLGYQVFANRKTISINETLRLDKETDDFIFNQFHNDIFKNLHRVPKIKGISLNQDTYNFWAKLGLGVL